MELESCPIQAKRGAEAKSVLKDMGMAAKILQSQTVKRIQIDRRIRDSHVWCDERGAK